MLENDRPNVLVYYDQCPRLTVLCVKLCIDRVPKSASTHKSPLHRNVSEHADFTELLCEASARKHTALRRPHIYRSPAIRN